MKQLLLVGAPLVLLALVVVWARREPESAPALEPGLARAVAEEVASDSDSSQVDRPPPPEQRELASPGPAQATEGARTEQVPDPAAAIDRLERRELLVHVHDTHGNPIHSASVRATGTRSIQEPGSWYGWRDATLVAVTDVEGTARLTYPVFLHGSGGGWLDVGEVCFIVTHPDFVQGDFEAEVTPGEYRVVLEQGTLVIVSGWIGARSIRIEDVRPAAPADG